MARILKDLLANDHPLFLMNIARLEQASGGAGIDTRLIGEIAEKSHQATRSLGLDSNDIKGEELYYALNNAVISGSAEIALRDTNYVLVNLGDGPVSLNYQDVVENAHHKLSYADRTLAHAQRHLRQEIIRRYAEHERTHPDLVHKLAEEVGIKLPNDEHYAKTQQIDDSDTPFILTIGDIVTDAFIKLRDDQARIDTEPDGSRRLSMEFGSKPPYERVDIVQAVGNSANAAVACTRLGLRAGLMAFIGDDQPGRDSLKYLASQHVDTSTVSVQNGLVSNYHYALRYGADRTILIKYEPYQYVWQQPSVRPDWIYLSMLSEDSWQLHEDLLNYLDQNPETKLVFQPGTFHFDWGTEKLARVYARSEIVFMNREEAMRVTSRPHDPIGDLLQGLHDLGVKTVIVTDGADGAYASDGSSKYRVPNYPDPAPPFDRTGAGDAFASTVTAALALGEPLKTALLWAPINSMSVVQKLGAQAGLLDRTKIEEYLAQAPEGYRVEELSA